MNKIQNIVNKIQDSIHESLEIIGLDKIDKTLINLEHPANEEYGDYSSNIAMQLFKQQNNFKNPRDFADEIIKNITLDKNISKISVEGAGFINFKLTDSFFKDKISVIINDEDSFGKTENNNSEKVYIEHTQPNTNKPNHIGHLRNSVLGMSLVHIFKAIGHDVVSTNINNDRGIANVKGMWAYLAYAKSIGKHHLNHLSKLQMKDDFDWKNTIKEWVSNPKLWKSPSMFNIKPDHWVGKFYVIGSSNYDNSEKVKNEMQDMVRSWENDDPAVKKLWKQMNDWFYEGSWKTLDRLGVDLDVQEYESEMYKKGKDIIEEAVKSNNAHFNKIAGGAIQVNLEDYGLPNKILVRSDGTAIYMTFDIELTRKRTIDYKMDRGIWIVGSDQELHFRQLFKICELLDIGHQKQWHHFSYGMVELPTGKMSSRKGTIVSVDSVLDQAVEKSKNIINSIDKVKPIDEKIDDLSEIIGIGAVKYAILMMKPQSKMKFNIDQALDFHGNSGPYLQYTYARCKSVMRKSSSHKGKSQDLNPEELAVAKQLYKYPEIVKEAANDLSPHLICTYLFELAQRYNTFYNKHSILQASENKQFRLELTLAVSIVIKNGLKLLGIEAPEKM